MSIVIHGMDMPTDKPIALIINPDGQVSEVGNFEKTWKATALERDRWISVEERLPEVDQPVMICAFGKSVGEGVYRGHDGFHHVWKMYTSSGTYWDDEVTHWMPLPEPYREERIDECEDCISRQAAIDARCNR